MFVISEIPSRLSRDSELFIIINEPTFLGKFFKLLNELFEHSNDPEIELMIIMSSIPSNPRSLITTFGLLTSTIIDFPEFLTVTFLGSISVLLESPNKIIAIYSLWASVNFSQLLWKSLLIIGAFLKAPPTFFITSLTPSSIDSWLSIRVIPDFSIKESKWFSTLLGVMFLWLWTTLSNALP